MTTSAQLLDQEASTCPKWHRVAIVYADDDDFPAIYEPTAGFGYRG
jgi:hypothetical protein